jgi:hypothetical protein
MIKMDRASYNEALINVYKHYPHLIFYVKFEVGIPSASKFLNNA